MPANPRVLYLRGSSGFYGPEKQIMLLVHGVRDAGFDPRILVLYRRGKTRPAIHPLVKRLQLQGMPADQLNDNAQFSSRTIWHIVQELKEGQFQILHAHGYKADILGLMAARLAGVPVIGTVRLHTETSLQLQLYKQLDLLALRLCDHVVTVSESLRQAVIKAGLAPGKVTAIWNAIDIEAFAVQATSGTTTCEDLGLRSNNHVVTAVGRLTPQKGYQYLL